MQFSPNDLPICVPPTMRAPSVEHPPSYCLAEIRQHGIKDPRRVYLDSTPFVPPTPREANPNSRLVTKNASLIWPGRKDSWGLRVSCIRESTS
jgi:hypothetical protein